MGGATPADVQTLTTDPDEVDRLLDGHTGPIVLDGFAGPGGWSTGIRDLLDDAGLAEIALEWDAAACETRIANGHTRTIRCDVAAYPLTPFVGRTVGVIESPPCQPFSLAGGKAGLEHLPDLATGAYDIILGRRTTEQVYDALTASGALTDEDGNPDPRNGLILQPARHIHGLADTLEWVALEQVPLCRPVYAAYAHALREVGWRTVIVVKLNSADYGVPQTRERVFLMAHRTDVVEIPAPTHTRGGEPADLFGPGRLPWVSMARALGWHGQVREIRGAGRIERHGDRDPRPTEEPAPTVDGGMYRRRELIPADISLSQRFTPATAEAGRFLLNRRAGKAGLDGSYSGEAPVVDVGVEPAPTAGDRPATVLASREIVQHPGATANRFNDSTKSRNDGLRILESEGAVLQGFPADYAWAGNKGKRWEQIGNVVCPPVARRVVAALLGRPDPPPAPWHTYAHTELACRP